MAFTRGDDERQADLLYATRLGIVQARVHAERGWHDYAQSTLQLSRDQIDAINA
jgi:hypothetical protein